jgi:IS5 family transposase
VNADLTRKGLLLRRGTMVDATIIAAPSSTMNADNARDPEMHQTKKGNQWYFGMKAHIGVDAESGLVHTVTTTAANAADVTQTEHLLHGSEVAVYADAGYTGAEHRVERKDISWHVAEKRGKVKAIVNDAIREATQGPGNPQGAHPRSSRASLPGGEAPVRIREGAIPRFGERTRLKC